MDFLFLTSNTLNVTFFPKQAKASELRWALSDGPTNPVLSLPWHVFLTLYWLHCLVESDGGIQAWNYLC